MKGVITMSDNSSQNAPGGGGQHAGGAGEGSDKPSSVSYDTYNRTVQSEKKLRDALRETQEKLAVFENEHKTREEQAMLDQKKHVEYIEQLKKQNAEILGENQRLKSEQTDFRKLNAAVGLLNEKGIRVDPQYYGHIRLDEIQFTENGVDHSSVATVIDTFQKEHPRLVAPSSKFLPSDKSGDSGAKMSIDDWKKIPDPKEKVEALRKGLVKHNFKFGK